MDYEREIEPFGPNEKCSDGVQLFGPDPPIFGFAPAAPMAPGRVLDPDGAACLSSSIAEPSPKVRCGVGSATLPPAGRIRWKRPTQISRRGAKWFLRYWFEMGDREAPGRATLIRGLTYLTHPAVRGELVRKMG